MAKSSNNNGDAKDAKQKGWTSKIPMVDLKTVIEVVTKIRNDALENASMPEVAKALGYKNATSSPFYNKMIAARLFNLLGQKSQLTPAAVDYIKPHNEEMKTMVLVGAVGGISIYRELINNYAGKKLNVSLVANSIEKTCNLTPECAATCAKAFEDSLRFAGMLSADGSVAPLPTKGTTSPDTETPDISAEVMTPKPNGEQTPKKANTQQHLLFLDKDKSRSFVFTGPLEITRAEYGRICKWLEFTMLIVEPEEKREGAGTT